VRAREGDLIQTIDKVIFDVKGLVHPPGKVVAFPRYIPDPGGSRGKQGATYSKVYNLSERFRYLQRNTPHLIVADPVFGERMCEVPVEEIIKRFDPVKALSELHKLSNLAPLQKKAIMLAEELQAASVIPWGSIGISGSVMAGLFTLQSDIDPLVYGTENCRRAYAAMKDLQKNGISRFKPYSRGELQTLFDFRSKDTAMSFEDFERVETRKAFQGMYDGTDYFVRFVKDWSENTEDYGDVCYENAGYTKLSATVTDDSEALFTPCSYQIGEVQVLEGPKLDSIVEIASFRGRFCQQAKIGEKVIVQGKAERVTNKRVGRCYYRVIIGNQPADFMALLKP
jgi:predicted nucleotidyltransferase